MAAMEKVVTVVMAALVVGSLIQPAHLGGQDMLTDADRLQTRCEAPPVVTGQVGRLTCTFDTDRPPYFYGVDFIPDSDPNSQETMVECDHRSNSDQGYHCVKHQGFSHNQTFGRQVVVHFANASTANEGKYVCQIIPAPGDDRLVKIHLCDFHLKDHWSSAGGNDTNTTDVSDRTVDTNTTDVSDRRITGTTVTAISASGAVVVAAIVAVMVVVVLVHRKRKKSQSKSSLCNTEDASLDSSDRGGEGEGGRRSADGSTQVEITSVTSSTSLIPRDTLDT